MTEKIKRCDNSKCPFCTKKTVEMESDGGPRAFVDNSEDYHGPNNHNAHSRGDDAYSIANKVSRAIFGQSIF